MLKKLYFKINILGKSVDYECFFVILCPILDFCAAGLHLVIYIEGLTGTKARAESALINIMSNVIYSIFY